MNAKKDLHYEQYLILSELHEPSGDCNLKEFLNITISVNPWLQSLHTITRLLYELVKIKKKWLIKKMINWPALSQWQWGNFLSRIIKKKQSAQEFRKKSRPTLFGNIWA